MPMYYGWRIVAAAAGLQFVYAALLLQGFGAYIAVLSDEYGWSKTALAGGAAIQSIEGAVIGPLLGWMVDRIGPRRVARLGVVLFALGFAAFSRIDTLTGFYAAVGLIAIGASLCGYFPLSVALMHFFERKRARALATMGLGMAGGGLAVPLVGWAMERYGWRDTALVSAGIIALVGWPLASMLRGNPTEVGATVDGLPPAPRSEADAAEDSGRDYTAGEALRTRAFWLLGVGHGMALLVVAAVNVHAISHMKESMGYTLAEASLVITMLTVAQALGMLIGAAVGDRWEKRVVAAGCMLAHASGLLLLTFASNAAMLVAFALLHGGAWGLRGPFMQALRADYFGLRAIGMILGLSAAIIAVGQVAGPLIAGAMADATGNYRSGFVLLAVLAASGSVLFLLARKPT